MKDLFDDIRRTDKEDFLLCVIITPATIVAMVFLTAIFH